MPLTRLQQIYKFFGRPFIKNPSKSGEGVKELMQQNLKGVPETLLIPLWARAVETKNQRPIIKDHKSVEIMGQIDYDFLKFKGAWMSQTGVAIRTEILDREVKTFINNYPDAVIINIGCGLDTRYFRIDNTRIRWYDLDLPESIQLRKNFFEETQRYRMIGKSVFDYSWTENIELKGARVLFIAEGIFMYFTEQEMIELMNKLVKLFPEAEMLFEMTPLLLVKNSKKHDAVSKMAARFQWGIRSGKEMQAINPQIIFLEEWNYFDYHHSRWKGLRWLALIPVFKNNFNNRIVHIAFSPANSPE